MAAEFQGKFKLISSERFDEFMQKLGKTADKIVLSCLINHVGLLLGVGFAMRKIAQATSPTVTITQAGDVWTIETHSAVKTTVISFKLGETFDEITPDGRSVKVSFCTSFHFDSMSHE